VYFDAAQYMCQAVSQFRYHFNDAYLGVFSLSTKSRILRHGTWCLCLVQTQTELTTVVTSFLCLSRTDLTRFHFEFHQNGFETTLAFGEAVLLQSFGERAFPVIVQSKVQTVQRQTAVEAVQRQTAVEAVQRQTAVEAVQRQTVASLMKCKLRTALFWVIAQRVVIPYRRFGTIYL